MWIESAISEMLLIVKKILATVRDTIFLPSRVLRLIKEGNTTSYIGASTHLFISIVLFAAYFVSKWSSITVVKGAIFLHYEQLFKKFLFELPASFNINSFFYAFPVFILGYILVDIVLNFIGLNNLWVKRLRQYIFLWGGTAILIYLVLMILVVPIANLICYLFGYEKYNDILAVYNTSSAIIQKGIYIIVSISPFIAVIKSFRMYPHYKLFIIPIMVAFSVDFVYYTERFLYKSFNIERRNPIVLKGDFSTDGIVFQNIYDRKTKKNNVRVDLIVVNESDSVLVLPKEEPLKIYKYTDKEIEIRDSLITQTSDVILKNIEADKRLPYLFHISSSESKTDSIIIFEPHDIKRLSFISESLPDSMPYVSFTVALAELNFYKTTAGTNVWEQYWIQRKIYQRLVFNQ